jgi:hypothetical protein
VAEVTWWLRLRWLALAIVPSALLLGVTLHIGTDIVAVPLLWVLPLALYLLTFVLVFARRRWLAPEWWLRGQVLFVVLVAAYFQTPLPHALLAVPLHFGAMFFTAMVCHGELARLRPRASHLTEFYLWMSIGGVVGGVLASIVAPLAFEGVLEYPLALLAGLLLRPIPARSWLAGRLGLPVPRAARWALDVALPGLLLALLSWGGDAENAWRAGVRATVVWAVERVPALGFAHVEELVPMAYALSVALACLCLAPRPLRLALGLFVAMRFTAPQVFGDPPERLLRARSFFGVYSVHEVQLPFGRFHLLHNGTTCHGAQNLDNPLGATTYYAREGPVGQFFQVAKDTPAGRGRIGVVGLGAGALACYAAPGQRMTFYEIDPLDERIARDPRYFTYLANCGKNVDVVIGDGRLALATEPDGAFDALIVDAFSGDAIPAHLLTREALALYMQKLTPDGLLLVHVTNLYLDLLPVVGNLVADAGLAARYIRGAQPPATALGSASDWVIVARKPASIARFGFVSPPWPELAPDPAKGLWTDDFTNVLEVLRLERYGLPAQ